MDAVHIVFWITFAAFIVSGLLYLIPGSTTPNPAPASAPVAAAPAATEPTSAAAAPQQEATV